MLTALAFDIIGAFDRVSEKRRVQRLWEEKIPLPLIRWVSCFLTELKAAVRLDGHTGVQESIEIGVPQGSPVAPILFTLFTAPMFRLFMGRNKKVGLAIRGLLTVQAKNESYSATAIQAAFALVEEWAHKNGMIFDPGKFEAIHFSRKRCFPDKEIGLPPAPQTENGTGTRIIKPIEKNSSMRWLGVYFDPRFSFAHYASKMATKGRQAAAGMAILGNTTRGADPGLMRQAVHACILPILTYGVPA